MNETLFFPKDKNGSLLAFQMSSVSEDILRPLKMKANPSSSKFSQCYNRFHSYVQTRGFKHDAPAMSSYELSVSIVTYSQSGKQNQQIYVFCNCFFYISESTNFFCELLSCANFQNYLLIMVAPRRTKFILLRALLLQNKKNN